MHVRGLTGSMGAASVLILTGCVDRAMVFGSRSGEPGDPCEMETDCIEGATCWNETCVQEGAVRVSLSWDVVSDFDLHVITPLGSHIFFDHMYADYGELDVDDCVHGMCRDAHSTHVENIFFEPAAPRGQYDVWVMNFDGRRAGDLRVEVAGVANELWTGELSAAEGATTQVWSFRWTE